MSTLIEKGIPIPEARTSSKYPFHEMEVGDSFFVEKAGLQSVYSILTRTNKKHAPKHWISRTVDGGVRIWRDK